MYTEKSPASAEQENKTAFETEIASKTEKIEKLKQLQEKLQNLEQTRNEEIENIEKLRILQEKLTSLERAKNEEIEKIQREKRELEEFKRQEEEKLALLIKQKEEEEERQRQLQAQQALDEKAESLMGDLKQEIFTELSNMNRKMLELEGKVKDFFQWYSTSISAMNGSSPLDEEMGSFEGQAKLDPVYQGEFQFKNNVSASVTVSASGFDGEKQEIGLTEQKESETDGYSIFQPVLEREVEVLKGNEQMLDTAFMQDTAQKVKDAGKDGFIELMRLQEERKRLLSTLE